MHCQSRLFTNHIEWSNQFASSNGSTPCLSSCLILNDTDTYIHSSEKIVVKIYLWVLFFVFVFFFGIANCPFIHFARSIAHTHTPSLAQCVFAFRTFLLYFNVVIFSVADAIHERLPYCTACVHRFATGFQCISQFYHMIVHQCTLHLPFNAAGDYTVCFNWKLPEMHCLWSGRFGNFHFRETIARSLATLLQLRYSHWELKLIRNIVNYMFKKTIQFWF